MSESYGEKLLTVLEVANALRVGVNTVYREIAKGNLKETRVGRLVRVRESEVTKYIGGAAFAASREETERAAAKDEILSSNLLAIHDDAEANLRHEGAWYTEQKELGARWVAEQKKRHNPPARVETLEYRIINNHYHWGWQDIVAHLKELVWAAHQEEAQR